MSQANQRRVMAELGGVFTFTVKKSNKINAVGIFFRCANVPNRTASVLLGLKSSPFSRNQRATSLTHTDSASNVVCAPGRTAMYNCVSSAYLC